MTSRFLCLIAASSLLAGSMAFAQQTGTAPAQQSSGAPEQQQRREFPAPTNLKVLPKDTSGQQIRTIMRGYAGNLGVECSYCHAKDPATGRTNFALDSNPVKDRARIMIKMTDTINADYLMELNPMPQNPVTCGTCHQGNPKPAVFVPKPHERPADHPPVQGGDAPQPH